MIGMDVELGSPNVMRKGELHELSVEAGQWNGSEDE